jgi:hypothetical protein
VTQEFKVGDKVKLANDTIAEVSVSRKIVRIEGSWFFAGDLELVERPKPALKVGDVVSANDERLQGLAPGSVLLDYYLPLVRLAGRNSHPNQWQWGDLHQGETFPLTDLGDRPLTVLHIRQRPL